MRRPRTPPAPVRAAQLDPEVDAALLRYCEARSLTISQAMRELLTTALRHAGAGGLGAMKLQRREALRTVKRDLMGALASAVDVDD